MNKKNPYKIKERDNSSFLICIYVLSIIYIVFNAFLSKYTFVDEGLCLLLFAFSVTKTKMIRSKEFLCFSFIVLFYLAYSLIRQINIPKAAIMDFLQFMKPFFCFYAVYYSNIHITEKQKRIMHRIAIFLGLYCLCILPFIIKLYPNTSDYYHACTFAALLFLISSNGTKRDFIISLIILSLGIAAFRSKFITELIIYGFIFFGIRRVKFSLRLLIIIGILAVAAIWINFEKFSMYFITGQEDGQARTYMYYTSFKLLKDYFPLGTGFGTFGTAAVGEFYSPLYYKYGLFYIWGLGPDDFHTDHSFITDTFYPVILGQFGIIGLILFIMFWIKRWKNAATVLFMNNKIFFMIFTYVIIENIASSAFLAATSVPIMMTLGMCTNKNMLK